jgi:hypothetical protein
VDSAFILKAADGPEYSLFWVGFAHLLGTCFGWVKSGNSRVNSEHLVMGTSGDFVILKKKDSPLPVARVAAKRRFEAA